LTLSVLVPTRDPPPRVAALLAPLRDVADEFVIAVDHRVDLDRLGAYEQIADRLLRFEPSGRDLAPGWMHRQCSSEWVLTLAGDEVPSAALVAALPALCADPAIRQYWLPVRWVWPDPEHWLDELPWAPDFHNRLLRNDDHLWFEGRTHSGAWPVLPARYVEAPVYHLDGVLLTEAERAEKVQRYAALRPGLVAPGGGELNERYYLPERHARLPLAAVPPADRARLAAVAGAPPGAASGPARGEVPVGRLADYEAHRALAALSEEDYRAAIRLLERDHRMLAGETRNVFAAVRNLGSATWPGGTGLPPEIRMAYRWRDGEGAVLVPDGHRTPFPAAVAPGEECILPVGVTAPETGGRLELALDVIHEHVRWFGCETRVAMDVTGPQRAEPRRRWRWRRR
jgi:hypothetical protein